MEPLAESVQSEHLPSMCRYTNKRCFNERAVKRGGKLHNLCEFHRRRANANQRRLGWRRRAKALHSACCQRHRLYASGYEEQPQAVIIRLACGPYSRLVAWQPTSPMMLEDMVRILASDVRSSLSRDRNPAPVVQSTTPSDCAQCYASDDESAVSTDTDVSEQVYAVPAVAPLWMSSGNESRTAEPAIGLEAFGDARAMSFEWLDATPDPFLDVSAEWDLDSVFETHAPDAA